MQANPTYDVAIIGGGLAGLSLSIQLARKGYQVVLMEKEKYPFHKVCGEYISMESWPFLKSLGIPLDELQLPAIGELQLSSPSGKIFTTGLPLGGFGISRYLLDQMLYRIAVNEGVQLIEGCRVDEVTYADKFHISGSKEQQPVSLSAIVCCGAFGKRSNLDVKWHRSFAQPSSRKLDNYIAVKYHIRTDWPAHRIGLHNFENGYCGISRIEEEKYCLCYLTTAANLKNSNSSIREMEARVLAVNPVLHSILKHAEREENFPLTIAQVSFSKKNQAEKNVLMIGDAAGMITPLCGNGMSMALHSSKIAYKLLDQYLQQQINLQQLLQQYRLQWTNEFGKRLAAGRTLQYFFGRKIFSNLFVSLFKTFPALAAGTIRQTHGQPF